MGSERSLSPYETLLYTVAGKVSMLDPFLHLLQIELYTFFSSNTANLMKNLIKLLTIECTVSTNFEQHDNQ